MSRTIDETTLTLHNFFYYEYMVRHAYSLQNKRLVERLVKTVKAFIRDKQSTVIPDGALDSICDGILEHSYLNIYNIDGVAPSSQEEWHAQFVKKYSEEDRDFFEWLTRQADSKVTHAIKRLCKISEDYGIFAHRILSFRNKDYPLKDFDINFLSEITEQNFFISTYAGRICPYMLSLSPSELGVEFDNTPCEISQLKKPHYAFFIDIHSKQFSISQAIEHFKKKLSSYVITSKLTSNEEFTEDDKLYIAEYFPAITASIIKPEGAWARLIGLKLWDLIEIDGLKPSEAHKKLIEESEIHGFRSVCQNENRPESCQSCVMDNIKNCFKICNNLYVVTKMSIEAGEILSENQAQQLKKKKMSALREHN